MKLSVRAPEAYPKYWAVSPAFTSTTVKPHILGSRGFTPDQNNKFVFLIDGSPITNIVQDGAYGILDMPDLDMVDRIEVVKGPGSTLYGSDASYGIINIITKT
jgi:iron complex outermembrane receptor protein